MQQQQSPQKKQIAIDLSPEAADGVYANTLSYQNPGSYEIRLIVEGETFQRQKTVHFEVEPLPPGAIV